MDNSKNTGTEQHNPYTFFSDLKDLVIDYAEKRFEITRLSAIEKVSKVTASVLSIILLGALLFFTLLFSGMMLGFFISRLTGSFYIGFGIVALVYLLMFVVVYLNRAKFEKPIVNMVVKIMTDKT